MIIMVWENRGRRTSTCEIKGKCNQYRISFKQAIQKGMETLTKK